MSLPRSCARVGVQRFALGLDPRPLARIAETGEALGDKPAHAHLAGGCQKGIGAVGPQPVRLREGAVQIPAFAGAFASCTIASGLVLRTA